MTRRRIDINADMGESYGRWTLGNDAELMPFLTSANIACGYHGGDPHVMRSTVRLAREHGSTATLDESFAKDVEAAIDSHRAPLNPPAWD